MKRFHYQQDRLLALKRQQLKQLEISIQKSAMLVRVISQELDRAESALVSVTEQLADGTSLDFINSQESMRYLHETIEDKQQQLRQQRETHKQLLLNHRELDAEVEAWDSLRNEAFYEFRASEQKKEDFELERRVLGQWHRDNVESQHQIDIVGGQNE